MEPHDATFRSPTSTRKSFRAFAATNPDGTFSLTTYDAKDGAPEGDYIVTLLYEPLDSQLDAK